VFRSRRILRLFLGLQIELYLLLGMLLCRSDSGRVPLELLRGECRCDGAEEQGIDLKN